MLSITALATVANAETLHTGTDFEETIGTNLFWATHNDSGTQTGETFYWYATNYVEQSSVDQSLGVYTNYETVVDNNTRYLTLDTEGNRVCRTIDLRQNCTAAPSSRPIFGTIYFDSLVQFTVNEDDEPTMQEGDKLAVWLQGGETTNLVVTAGFVDDQGTVTKTNYVIDASVVSVEPGTWYRITIGAANLIDGAETDNGYLGFTIRIDGNYVTTTQEKMTQNDAKGCLGAMLTSGTPATISATEMPKLFPSLVKGGSGTVGCDQLSYVGFEGTGAIDNLLFTDENPVRSSNPTVDGVEVDATNVFITARSNKPIVYPTAPTITTNGEGVVSIGFAGTSVDVPEWYDVSSADGLTVNLTLNSNALPTIGATNVTVGEETEAKEAIEVDATTFTATLTSTSTKLYYGLKVAASPNAAEWTAGELKQGTGAAMQISADKPKDGSDPLPAGFFKVYVTDVNE